MTYTGLSCQHKREKNKHGCSNAKEYYCSETGKMIDPHSCFFNCKNMLVIADMWRQQRKKKDDEVAIL